MSVGDTVLVTFYGVETKAVVCAEPRNGIVFVILNGRKRWFHVISVKAI